MNTTPLKRFPEWVKPDSKDLAAWRYWTQDMISIWWPEQTFQFSLKAQAEAISALSELAPDLVSKDVAKEVSNKADISAVNPDRIRELEERTWHDVIAINTALEEVLSKDAKPFVNMWRTSADTTQTARALQLKASLEVVAWSVENLRDILLEKAIAWKDVPHMDTTHLYDALPTLAWRPLAHYVEMLQTGLNLLKYMYENSIVWKWWDATGNHHAVWVIWLDWVELQKIYTDKLKIWHMTASAQTPWLEFEADIIYCMSRIWETLNNIAKYIAWWRSDDVNIFVNWSPKKKKGSSAMPHKDAKNWNPTVEEQIMSLRNYLSWNMITWMMNCEFPYARNLSGSSSARINLEDWFKFLDHWIRNLANLIYWLNLREERCIERVNRSFGVVTSAQVMTYLTDPRKVENPMTRSQAHDLMWELAKKAWDEKRQFIDILLENDEVTQRLDEDTLREITNPLTYIWQSKEIIESVFKKYHWQKTL